MGTMGQEKARDVGKCCKVELEANRPAEPLSFLVWFTNSINREITDEREIKKAEIAEDGFSKGPKSVAASGG